MKRKPKAEQPPKLDEHANAMGRDNFFDMVNDFSRRKLESLNIPHQNSISKWRRRYNEPEHEAYVDVAVGDAPCCFAIVSFSVFERHSSINMFLASLGARIEIAARDAVLLVKDG